MSILDAFYNNFSLVTSIISLLIAIPLWRFFRNRLPSTKMKALDELLTDTKKLFYSAMWDGTLDDDKAVDLIQDQIWECVFRAPKRYCALLIFTSTQH